MPDFTAPAYRSYIALCQELRLPREVQAGDWGIVWHDTEHGPYINTSFCWRHPTEGWFRGGGFDQRDEKHWDVWLPTGEDWDEMLEAAGCRTYYVTRLANGEYQAGTLNGPFANASSRLEAKARLWMEITGRDANRG